MEKVIIAAYSGDDQVIGDIDKNDMLWHIRDDMLRFKRLTIGHPVIMGRKTWESLEDYQPLPKRPNIIISSNPAYSLVDGDVKLVGSLDGAIDYAETRGGDEMFFIGGQKVYEDAIKIADRLEITEVLGDYQGDRFFPRIDENIWKEVRREDKEGFSFVTYRKGKAFRNKLS